MCRSSDTAARRPGVHRAVRGPRGRSGSALLAVLLLVVLLAFVTAAFIEESTSRIKYYGLYHNRDDLRTEAYSALEATFAVLAVYEEIDKSFFGPSQGWGDPLQASGFKPDENCQVQVRVVDESGKFALARLIKDVRTLKQLFRHLGFDSRTQDALTDAWVDWQDEDDLRSLNGFDTEQYERLSPPYRAPNRPMKSWDELPFIHGFQEAFWDEETGAPKPELKRLQDMIALDFDGPANVNALNADAIAICQELGILDERQLERHRSGRDGEVGTEDDQLVRDDSAGVFNNGTHELVDMKATQLRAEIEVVRGEARFLLTARVLTKDGSTAKKKGTEGGEKQPEEGEPPPEGSDPNNPGAEGDSQTPGEGGTNDPNQPSGSKDPAGDTGGVQTQTPTGPGAALKYPFTIVTLIENKRFE